MNQGLEKISIEITVSEGLKSLLQSVASSLEGLNRENSQHPAGGEDEILTPDELSELFKIPKSKVYAMTMKTGPEAIPRFKVGRDLRFKRSEVLLWFEKQVEPPA